MFVNLLSNSQTDRKIIIPAGPRRVSRALAISVALLLLIGFCCAAPARAENPKNLKPQGYVNDFAGVLSAGAKEKLTALCQEVDQKAAAQIAIVTVRSLDGAEAADYAVNLAEQWGVGPKKKDRGILILLAPNDHKYFVTVGYGLEPILPDGKVGGFGREMLPLLRQNDYSGALLLLTQRIANVIAQDRGVSLTQQSGQVTGRASRPSPPENGVPVITILLLLAFIVFPLLGFLFRLLFGFGGARRRGRGWGGGPWFMGGGSGWGGGGFGGGGGGGGFGGFGGGGFGGGGAGGSW